VEYPPVKVEEFCSASNFDVVTQRVPKYNFKSQNYNHSRKKPDCGIKPEDFKM
jgi:hypothetical protein